MGERIADATMYQADVDLMAMGVKRVAEALIQLDDRAIKAHKIRLLTPKSRLLILLAAHGTVTVKMALIDTDLSYRAFYIMRDKLVAQGLIKVVRVKGDDRMRGLTLAKAFLGFKP